MKDWAWLTPVGYVVAAVVAGLFLWFNNRKSPYEDLKVLVDIHKDLPEMPEKEILRIAIARQLSVLTAEPPKQSELTSEEQQEALGDDHTGVESDGPSDADIAAALNRIRWDNKTVDKWKVSKIEQTSRTNAMILRAISWIVLAVVVALGGSGVIQRIFEFFTN